MKIKETIALMLTLALLAGCGGPAESSGSLPAGSQSAPQGTEETEGDALSPEELEQLEGLAFCYERYCGGRSLDQGETVEATSWMAIAYLMENGLGDVFDWDDETSGSVSYGLLEEINSLFFPWVQPLSPAEKEERFYFYHEDTGLPYSLALQEAVRQADGTIEATYRREHPEGDLYPVTYTFYPFRLEQVPEVLSALHRPGDTLYRILGVAQRPDLLPEGEPQTITIATAEELVAAAERINQARYQDRFDTYLLTADIDLAGVEWTPMGMGNQLLDFGWEDQRDPNLQGFNGTFDGQGHTISNLSIPLERGRALLETGEKDHPDRKLAGAALFYRIGEQGVIKNLKLENATVLLPLEQGRDTSNQAALLAVSCCGRIENVQVQGTVQGVSAAGLVGTLGPNEDLSAGGVAKNCTAKVDVTGNGGVGGIAGTLHYGTLEGCTAAGTVTAAPLSGTGEGMPGNIGGMMGHSVQGVANDCVTSVQVFTKAPSRCVGSFCGLAEGGAIKSCWVEGAGAGSWETVDDFHRMETPEVGVR